MKHRVHEADLRSVGCLSLIQRWRLTYREVVRDVRLVLNELEDPLEGEVIILRHEDGLDVVI